MSQSSALCDEDAYAVYRVMAHPRVLAWMEEQTGARYNDEIDETLEFWADL